MNQRADPGTAAAETALRAIAYDARLVLDENDRLRARVADLEETVRILRVQLPLMPYALGPDPAGPDPRWAAPTIPAPRDPNRDAAPPGAAPTRSPSR